MPAGIADAVMAPMLGPDGRTLAARGWFDTESLAEQDGVFYVGIERVNRIVRFDFAKFGVRARAAVGPDAARHLHAAQQQGPRGARLRAARAASSPEP